MLYHCYIVKLHNLKLNTKNFSDYLRIEILAFVIICCLGEVL